MSLRMLRTLVAVQDHGTFGAAAAAVCVSHAAVSQQMRNLEELWQVQLFDRSRRTPALTPTGRALAAKARDILRDYDNLVPSVVGAAAVQGELAIGAVPTTLTGLVPKAVSALKARFPELLVRIAPGLSNALALQIDRGLLDAAIVSAGAPLSSRHEFRVVAEEPMELLAQAREPLEDPIELLRSRPFIRFSREDVVGRLVDEWLENTGVEVSEAMELHDLEAISSMVHAGLGVSVVPRRCVEPATSPQLRRIPLGRDAPRRTLGLLARKDGSRALAVDALHDALLAAAGGQPARTGKPRGARRGAQLGSGAAKSRRKTPKGDRS